MSVHVSIRECACVCFVSFSLCVKRERGAAMGGLGSVYVSPRGAEVLRLVVSAT